MTSGFLRSSSAGSAIDDNHSRASAFDRRTLLRGLTATASGLLVAGAAGACGTATVDGPGNPRHGGRVRAAASGASVSGDTMHPFVAGAWGTGIVMKNIYDKLCVYNDDLTVSMQLAETIEPNTDGTRWTIRLRDGVQFHNGKPLVAEDLIYSLRYLLDPNQTFTGALDLSMVDAPGVRKLDNRTVEVPMHQPLADLPGLLAGWYNYVLPEGAAAFDNEHPPIGTGPFQFEHWRPGERVELRRNDNYWIDGRPYLDELEIIYVTRADTRLNALLGEQAEVAHELSATQTAAQERNGRIGITASPLGRMQSLAMRMDTAPYNDPDVRQALQYAVDRQEIVDTVYSGYADIGNDMYGLGSPMYNSDLPQRSYDPERAKRLLRRAGKEDLHVTLHTSDVTPGWPESAALFAEQAKAAGITVELRKSAADSYWTSVWGTEPFVHAGWGTYSLDWFFGQAIVSNAENNETAWRRPGWDQRYYTARGTMDPQLRAQRYADLQHELWAEGGYVGYAFMQWIDGAASNVGGLRTGPAGAGSWGDYRDVWLGA